MPSKVIIVTMKLMFLGINKLWPLSELFWWAQTFMYAREYEPNCLHLDALQSDNSSNKVNVFGNK